MSSSRFDCDRSQDDTDLFHSPATAGAAVDGGLLIFYAIAGRDGDRATQKFAAEDELVGATAVSEEAVMADAVKPVEQRV